MLQKLLTIMVLSTVLIACGEPPTAANAEQELNSRALTPTDPEVADIYNRSCRNCHTVAATGSPLTGDAAAWEPRMAKGIDTLLDNVINGFGGMPPFGLCMDCDADQFEALIVFMGQSNGELE